MAYGAYDLAWSRRAALMAIMRRCTQMVICGQSLRSLWWLCLRGLGHLCVCIWVLWELSHDKHWIVVGEFQKVKSWDSEQYLLWISSCELSVYLEFNSWTNHASLLVSVIGQWITILQAWVCMFFMPVCVTLKSTNQYQYLKFWWYFNCFCKLLPPGVVLLLDNIVLIHKQ